MDQTDVMSLDSRVKSYIEDWEMDVRRELKSAKMRLFQVGTPPSRVLLKTEIETLTAVLDLLQGKGPQEPPTMTKLREENASLKAKLREAESKQKEAASSLFAHKKINRDLKNQLYQCREKQIQTLKAADKANQDILRQLKEVELISATKLSVESAINMDLTCQLEEAHKQLQQQTEANQATREGMDLCVSAEDIQVQVTENDHKLELPEEEAPKNEEDKEALQSNMEELKSDHHVVDEECIEKKEEKVVCLKTTELQKITEAAVTEIWEQKQAMMRSQRLEIAKLQAAARTAEEQLKTQDQESKQVLQSKEQEWALRFEEQDRLLKEMSERKRRRRNWFVRMFVCGSGRAAEE